MIFVLTMLLTFVYDRKNENHWSLLIIRYSLLITWNTNTQLRCKLQEQLHRVTYNCKFIKLEVKLGHSHFAGLTLLRHKVLSRW